ncbi:MAG: SGNH/GDSL hydrolase family protein [Elusimicrobiota bacterium]|nr:SGNH/GDSL hydrolase family protein [Elusimicrobiota bacterium]
MGPSRRKAPDYAGAAAGLLVLAGLLLAGEALVRGFWGPPAAAIEGPGSDFDYFHLEIHEPFFARTWMGRLRAQRSRANPEELAALKPEGLLRVFVLGGSVAMPLADEQKSRLGEFLRRALPGRRVEVVGMGMGGYDSYRESLLQREALELEPDLIVLLSGNNEYTSGAPIRSPALYRLNRALRRSALYARLQDRLSPRRPEPPVSLDDRLQRFEDNLELMARRARERGVPMLLCTLPVNVRDVAPVYAQYSPDPAYVEAWLAYDAGALKEAKARFEDFVAAHPKDALGAYWLAKIHDRLGDAAAARAGYHRAIDLDDPGDRCSPRRNAVIRQVAARGSAGLVDLEAVFTRRVPDGLLDSRLFKDNVHWFDELYPAVSLAIVKAARERGYLAPAEQWDASWMPALERELARAKVPRPRLAQYAEAAFFVGVTNAYRAQGMREPAISFFEMAPRLDPGAPARLAASADGVGAAIRANPWTAYYRERFEAGWPHVLLHVGEACRRMGLREDARRLLSEAARLRPEDPVAPFALALLNGDRAELARIAADAREPVLANAARLSLARLGAPARAGNGLRR